MINVTFKSHLVTEYNFRAFAEDMLGLGQIISFIANEGKFKFKCERSIENSISLWPGMVHHNHKIDSVEYSNDLRW